MSCLHRFSLRHPAVVTCGSTPNHRALEHAEALHGGTTALTTRKRSTRTLLDFVSQVRGDWVDFERNYQFIDIGSGAHIGLGLPGTTWRAEVKAKEGTNNNPELPLVIFLVGRLLQPMEVVPRLPVPSTEDLTADLRSLHLLPKGYVRGTTGLTAEGWSCSAASACDVARTWR